MKMKKMLGILLSVTVLGSTLVACSGGSASSTADSTVASTSTATSAAATGDGLNIAIVTSPSGVDDGSFNEDNYNGILSFIKTDPASKVTPIQETEENNSVPAVENIVSDYDVIVTPGYQFAGIAQIAEENPDKNFILVDSFPSDGENDVEVDNIYAMTFAEQESGFFAGVAAALETKSNKVAVVNGSPYPSNVNYQFGFESGVNYSNENLGTNVEVVEIASYAGTDVTGQNVGGNYINSFNDPATGKLVGEALLKEGVDIIFVAAGNSGNGVFTAVRETTGAYVIGCDVDQYNDGVNGSSNIVLTSALKIMNTNVERVLNEVKDGTFKGENVVLGASTDSTGYVKEAGRNQLSESTITQLDEVYALVKDGTVVPASNFSGTTPEDFPGLK